MCLGPRGAQLAARQGSGSCCLQTPSAHQSIAGGGIWWPCSPAVMRPEQVISRADTLFLQSMSVMC